MKNQFVLLAVLAVMCIAASAQTAGPYTFDQLIQNNTAACSYNGYGLLNTPYCTATFPADWNDYFSGWDDDQAYNSNGTLAPILTVYHDPSPAGTYSTTSGTWNYLWNIAKQRTSPICTKCPDPADMHSLMYGTGSNGQATKVIVETQSWFCDPAAPRDQGTDCPNTNSYWDPVDQYDGVPNQQVNLYYSHAQVQYTAWNQPTMNARAVDIWDRGGDAVAMDWYGAPNDCPTTCTTSTCNYSISQFTNACSAKYQYSNQSYLDMVYSIQTFLPQQRANADMGFLMMLDHGAWTPATICGVNGSNTGAYEPQCALDKMISDLKYSLSPYLNQANYFKVRSNGKSRPVIALFQNEGDPKNSDAGSDFVQCNTLPTCYYDDNLDKCTSASSCYSAVYAALRSWLDNSSGLGANNYYLIFGYQDGCPGGNEPHPYSDGCYFWIKPHENTSPAAVTVENQLYNDNTSGNTSPKQSADNFYANSLNQTGTNGQPAFIAGGVYKGFDDYMATWWLDRALTQGCGTTWLSSWAEMTNGGDYGPTKPLPYVMVETWDDYEEGTEIETGISNCVLDSSFTLTLNAPTLQWSYSFNDPDPHDLSGMIDNTVDHYVLWYTTNNTNYYIMDPDISPSEAGCSTQTDNVRCTGVNLTNYAGWGTSNTLYIQAVGKPGITNNMSDSIVYNP